MRERRERPPPTLSELTSKPARICALLSMLYVASTGSPEAGVCTGEGASCVASPRMAACRSTNADKRGVQTRAACTVQAWSGYAHVATAANAWGTPMQEQELRHYIG